MLKFLKPIIVAAFALSAFGAIPAVADDTKPTPTPVTTADPAIPVGELDIMAAPMSVEELKVEADGWLQLVKEAAQKVSAAKLRIKRQDEKQEVAEDKAEAAEDADSKTGDQRQGPAQADQAEADQARVNAEQAGDQKKAAMAELTALRGERTELIDRLDVILEEFNEKIGLDENGKEKDEVLVYRRYIDAVGGIKVDVTDTETAVSSILGWIKSTEGGLRWARNIVTFLVIIFAFGLLGRVLSKATRKALEMSPNKSVLLTEFLAGMVHRVALAVGIIIGLSALEVNIGPLLAIIGAAGFVVAFALQGTLSNFASGIMIMLYRPFDVDNSVEVAGVSGKVKSLSLVSTTITTFDNKVMVVPNNEIWGNIITNATGSSERRVDMVFGIGYDDDIGHAKLVLEEIVDSHPLVLKDPAPVIQLHELADSSVNFVCRPWTKTGDYWTVYWDVTRNVKERFDAEGLSIPYPQRDVHVYQEHKALPQPDSGGDHRDTTRGADQMGLEGIDSTGN